MCEIILTGADIENNGITKVTMKDKYHDMTIKSITIRLLDNPENRKDIKMESDDK